MNLAYMLILNKKAYAPLKIEITGVNFILI